MEATQQEWEVGQRERWTIDRGIEKLEAQLPAIKRLQQQLAAEKAVNSTKQVKNEIPSKNYF